MSKFPAARPLEIEHVPFRSFEFESPVDRPVEIQMVDRRRFARGDAHFL